MSVVPVPTPSAPTEFNIAATFFAYSVLEASSFAPAEKPAVLPQPPMAIITFVPFEKRLRIVDNGSKGVKFPGGSVVKRDEFANPMMAWVIPLVRFFPGRVEL